LAAPCHLSVFHSSFSSSTQNNPSDKITSNIINNIFDKTQKAPKIQIEG